MAGGPDPVGGLHHLVPIPNLILRRSMDQHARFTTGMRQTTSGEGRAPPLGPAGNDVWWEGGRGVGCGAQWPLWGLGPATGNQRPSGGRLQPAVRA